MLCEKCKKNEANIHLIQSINGEKSTINICEECAKRLSNSSFSTSLEKKGASFNNMINLFLKDSYNEEPKSSNIFCKACGLTYDEFKKNKILGCSRCYHFFKNDIEDSIKKIHGSTMHKGKIPKNIYEFIKYSKKIRELKLELKRAIVVEEYERAAILRDEIKVLESNYKEGASS